MVRKVTCPCLSFVNCQEVSTVLLMRLTATVYLSFFSPSGWFAPCFLNPHSLRDITSALNFSKPTPLQCFHKGIISAKPLNLAGWLINWSESHSLEACDDAAVLSWEKKKKTKRGAVMKQTQNPGRMGFCQQWCLRANELHLWTHML